MEGELRSVSLCLLDDVNMPSVSEWVRQFLADN